MVNDAIRKAIICGCGPNSIGCVNVAGWRTVACRCACHLSQQQLQVVIVAACKDENIAGFVKRQIGKGAAEEAKKGQFVVTHSCGHPRSFEKPPSVMSRQYVQQNRCDDCAALVAF